MTDWMREQAYEMGDESAYFPDEEGAAMTPLSIDSDERKKDESIWVVESKPLLDESAGWRFRSAWDSEWAAKETLRSLHALVYLENDWRIRRYVPAHAQGEAEAEGKAADD